jgi:hypothetical protein
MWTVFAVLGVSGTAGATLLGYEGFDGYTVGAAMTGQSGSGNIGFAPASTWGGGGAKHVVQATGLNYTNGMPLVTSGGSILSVGFANDTRPLAAALPTTSATGGELWVSYLFQSGPNREDANLVRFYAGGDQDGQRIDINVVREWPSLNPQVNVGAWFNNSPGGGTPLFNPPGSVDLIVLQYVLDDSNTPGNQGVMYAYVNPVIGGAQPSIASAAVTFAGQGGFDSPDALRFFSPGGGDFAVVRDELRWGTSFASVTPVIPEPTALGLLAIAGGSLAAVRRRI